MDSVQIVRFGQCMSGLMMRDEKTNELKPVRKRTIMMMNAREVARRLDSQCPNSVARKHGCASSSAGYNASLYQTHDHLQLKGGSRCRRAQVHPRKLCRTICAPRKTGPTR